MLLLSIVFVPINFIFKIKIFILFLFTSDNYCLAFLYGLIPYGDDLISDFLREDINSIYTVELLNLFFYLNI